MALVEGGIQIDARVFTAGQAGVEMEAMTAMSVCSYGLRYAEVYRARH